MAVGFGYDSVSMVIVKRKKWLDLSDKSVCLSVIVCVRIVRLLSTDLLSSSYGKQAIFE